MEMSGARGRRTLVVDGVPKSENRQHGDDDGRGGGVLAIKVARLDATHGRFGRGSLWELRVKCDEGAEVCALPRGLWTTGFLIGETPLSEKKSGRVGYLIGGLTRVEGEAILGGTRPENCRRMRDARISSQTVVDRLVVRLVFVLSAAGLSPALADPISQHTSSNHQPTTNLKPLV
jgi:hypothetical protein